MADDAEGRNLLYSRLRQMPKVQDPHPLTTKDIDPNDGTLAIRPMGSGHHGTSPRRMKAAEIPCRWHQLFHQVGGSRTTCDNHGEERKGVHMEDNHMQVWNPQDFHIRQWTTV